jgi:hypothetical protein
VQFVFDVGNYSGLNIDTDTFTDHSISSGITNFSSVTVIRRPDPEWELIIDGTSQGTTTDTSTADVGYLTFAQRDASYTVDSFKVS